jgi:NAD(P)H dehydrogenase (quinone)
MRITILHGIEEPAMTVKVAVIYYSATGTVHALAQAVAEGAVSAGPGVRLRRVAELAPDSAIDENPLWRRHADAATSIAQASVADLAWADAFAFGTPTPFGAPAARLLAGSRVTDADGNARATGAGRTPQAV